MVGSLPVLNLSQAKYECTFGRGCDGICCQNGRPPVYPEEQERIDANLEKLLPRLSPEARALVEQKGYLSERTKLDVLRGMRRIKVCVGYSLDGSERDELPTDPSEIARAQPIYEELDGWDADTSNVRDFDALLFAHGVLKSVQRHNCLHLSFVG